MEEFQDKYIEDAKELIASIEGSLIEFEENPQDPKLIEEIFRFMHTLKGSAGMFGFKKIEELTHRLENIYDNIREGIYGVDSEIIDVTLDAVDLIKSLLIPDEEIEAETQATYQEVYGKCLKLLETNSENAPESTEDVPQKPEDEEPEDEGSYFLLKLTPKPYIYERGVKPLNVFTELNDVGEYKAFLFADKLPAIQDLDAKHMYLWWEIIIYSKEGINPVEDVFLFFEEEEFDISPIPKGKDERHAMLKGHSEAYRQQPEAVEENLAQAPQTVPQEEDTADGPTPHTAKKPKKKQTASTDANREEISKEESIRVSAGKLDELVNLVSDLVTLNSRMELINGRLKDDDMTKALKSLSKLSKRFRENALELRLMPIQVLVVKFKRLVRDLSRQLNKDVEFTAEGVYTKLDKSILERIESPLMHIIRNAIDHGIESPKEREAKNKPARGIVRMVAFYSGANVFIQIRDDGKGIDQEMIRKKGIEKGIIKEDTQLRENDIYDLMFEPGFSTAQSLTEVSGRGVGMDVVKRNISELRGEINIESEIDLGTSVTLKLPLTLSIIDALLVKISNWKLLVPISSVEIVRAISTEELNKNTKLQIEYNETLIPLINTRAFMGIKGEVPHSQNIIIISHEGRHYGLIVDEIIAEHQAVIKPLGYLHKGQEYLSGASVLGDGSLALIVNIKSLIKHKTEKFHFLQR